MCFVHFDLEICFAPQRRALFRHLNVKSCPIPSVFLHFWLGNALRATTACNFSSFIWPAGSLPAALASLLFDPPEPQIIEKTEWIATSLPFRAPASSFFSLFSALIFSLPLFSSLTLPTSACPFVHIVGSLTSKLPSIMEDTIQIGDDWGYPYFRKPPYIYIHIHIFFIETIEMYRSSDRNWINLDVDLHGKLTYILQCSTQKWSDLGWIWVVETHAAGDVRYLVAWIQSLVCQITVSCTVYVCIHRYCI